MAIPLPISSQSILCLTMYRPLSLRRLPPLSQTRRRAANTLHRRTNYEHAQQQRRCVKEGQCVSRMKHGSDDAAGNAQQCWNKQRKQIPSTTEHHEESGHRDIECVEGNGEKHAHDRKSGDSVICLQKNASQGRKRFRPRQKLRSAMLNVTGILMKGNCAFARKVATRSCQYRY